VNVDERHADRNEVTEAQVMMESAGWLTLTERQRGVVAWLAGGLGTQAIAARTGGTPQSVRNLFIAARWRVMGQQGGEPDVADADRATNAALEAVLPNVNDSDLAHGNQQEQMADAPMPADMPEPVNANDGAEALPAEDAPRSESHEPIATEPAATRTDDGDADCRGDDDDAASRPPNETASQPFQSEQPRMKLSSLQRKKPKHWFRIEL
jgi:hypothetical protein